MNNSFKTQAILGQIAILSLNNHEQFKEQISSLLSIYVERKKTLFDNEVVCGISGFDLSSGKIIDENEFKLSALEHINAVHQYVVKKMTRLLFLERKFIQEKNAEKADPNYFYTQRAELIDALKEINAPILNQCTEFTFKSSIDLNNTLLILSKGVKDLVFDYLAPNGTLSLIVWHPSESYYNILAFFGINEESTPQNSPFIGFSTAPILPLVPGFKNQQDLERILQLEKEKTTKV